MTLLKLPDMKAWPPEFDFWDPCTGRRKVHHLNTHTYTQIHISKLKRGGSGGMRRQVWHSVEAVYLEVISICVGLNTCIPV